MMAEEEIIYEESRDEEAKEDPPESGILNKDKESDEEGDGVKDRIAVIRRLSKREVSTSMTLALSNFCYGAGISLLAPFFPSQAETKGVSRTLYGLILSIYPLAILITAPIFMKATTLVPSKLILCTGLFTIGISEILFGILEVCHAGWPYITLAFLIRFVDGVGAASMKTSSYAIVSSLFPNDFSMHTAVDIFLVLGLTLGPMIGGALYDAHGFGLPFYVVGVLTVCAGICAIFLIFESESKDNFPTEDMRRMLKDMGVLISLLVFVFSFTFVGFLLANLESHLKTFQLSGVYKGLIFAIPAFMYSLTAPGWKWITDGKFNDLLMTDIACSIVAASLILIGPAPFIHRQPALNFVIAALFLKGIGMGGKIMCSFYGTLDGVRSKKLVANDVSAHGVLSAVFFSSVLLGIFLGSSFGGYISDSIGFAEGTIILLFMEALTMALVFVYAFKKKYRRPRDSRSFQESQPILRQR